MTNLDKIKDIFDKNETFLVTTHVLPDGDGLGGEIALGGYLKQLGKTFRIINHDETPEKFNFLDSRGWIEVCSDLKSNISAPDVIILVDCGELSRVGSVADEIKKFKSKILVIDHHINKLRDIEEQFVDTNASSIGEMLYRYFTHVETEITFEMAQALYVSILTDTGSFRHSRTTSLSHIIAARLIDLGVDPEATYQKIYATDSVAKIRLLGEVLSRLKVESGGRLVWSVITKPEREMYGATEDDPSSFIDIFMLIEPVEIAALIREDDSGMMKVSLRSKGDFDVFKVAEALGGGGHTYAAGASIRGGMEEVVKKVVERCKEIIKSGVRK
ncbi:MAG: hypothetical protein A3F16_04165 [Deltaproteobacteria bacterium RIFCSPHIGHO2_12_FULL_43_9]|nr:MAG: hypothetical protein A3F16_04165 [Deltaproteobacteria bacterium RIFCSPHIGHO2_12_FULL_43_9]